MSSFRHHRVLGACLAPLCCLLLSLTLSSAGQAMTAAAYLSSLPKPHFAPGNTLPLLSKWSWPLPVDLRIELSKEWGYALECYPSVKTMDADLANPNSELSRLMALANADPKRYGLLLYVARTMPNPLPPAAWTYDAQGNLALGAKVWSPEAPDVIFQSLAASWAVPLKQVSDRAPVAIVLNGGEYALGVVGGNVNYWKASPAVLAAKGNRDWFSYISERKAHQEMIISKAMRDAVPNRQFYLYYITSSGSARNRWGGWVDYGFGYQWINTVGDLPCESMYYRQSNDGWVPKDALQNDMLTQALNSVGEAIKYGHPLSYNFVEGGWPQPTLNDGGFSDIPRYMGFLKCYYTAGMIGGVASYCKYPDGGFAADVDPDNPPQWLLQMLALSRVHALFSGLEPFLRDGYLLPGPAKHVWSKDQPAYEFPTGNMNTRVLARKMKSSNEWLVTAWAADGNDRNVVVSIPDIGSLMLKARACGSVYHVTLKGATPVVSLVDVDGLLPSANSLTPDITPTSSPSTPPALTQVSLQADQISPQLMGIPIQLTATPDGGANVDYQFRAGYQDAAGWHWSVLQDYAADSTCTWTPQEPRTYTLVVWAREAEHTNAYDGYGTLPFRTSSIPISAVNLASDLPSPQPAYTPITLAATPTGGCKVEYKFRAGCLDATGWHWSDLGAYSTSPTCQWTPTTTHTFVLVVWAREVGHGNAYDAYAALTFL